MEVGLQVLDEVPQSRADWILWVDMDVILADTIFDFPFSKYGGKDLVMWGRADDIARGNPHGAPLPFQIYWFGTHINEHSLQQRVYG